MIDLTNKGLPNVIVINGKPFSIFTDFRLWMRFEISITHAKKDEPIEIGYLFMNERPIMCNVSDLYQFSRPEQVLPRQIGHESDAIALDFEIDSDLIYAAFKGQYNIDLVDIDELHWWKFLAMLRGLNESTVLHQVMQYRVYEPNHDKKSDPYQRLKDMWTIDRMTPEEQAEIDEINKMFK